MSGHRISIIIQSRLSSSRLPAKALLPLCGYPTVVLCALRAGNTGLPVVVATSDNASDDFIVSTLNQNNIPYFRGSLDDVLLRFTQVIENRDDNDLVIRITADNVFPDGNFLELLVNQFNSDLYDYLGTVFPEDGLPYGVGAEVFKVGVLREANKKAVSQFDREHVTPYIRRNFRCQQFILEHRSKNWNHLRCTLDTFEDYIQLLELFQHIKKPLHILWSDLIRQLEQGYLDSFSAKNENTRDIGLTLGTAQLGLNYGFANQQGMLTEKVSGDLIHRAVTSGVKTFDTARAYGVSERRLGQVLKTNKSDVRVITKLHPLDYLSDEASEAQVQHAVKASIYESCYDLKVDYIDTLLLHRSAHLHQWNGAVWRELLLLRQEGLIKSLGVSVSTPSEAIAALKLVEIEHVQCPVNILDWRWHQSDFLDAVSNRKDVSYFARSVYLQGLLLMEVDRWPKFSEVDTVAINQILDDLVKQFKRLSRKDLCLAYVRGLSWVNSTVVGMETEQQLEENLALFGQAPLSSEQITEVNHVIPSLPESFLNPAKWRL